MDITSTLSLLAGLCGAYYAYKAYINSREVSFPKNHARKKPILLENFHGTSDAFEKFITENVQKTVFINVIIDEDSFNAEVNEDGGGYFVVWTNCFETLNLGEKPSSRKCSGLEIHIEKGDSHDARFYWFRGAYFLTGYFSVIACSGPHQGMWGATLRPEKIR
ncbi:hypothetical protein LU196_15300 [Pantoea sp. Mb-10]|uniref:hypothetical protein n=1 Tax=unclassified Pantoea TaxID=2630326 RepID=UPI001E39F8F1|nr:MULTISPECIES: hypothetical protein [unclassified Pantoea]MCE0491408.1 hypothetical protein [Pantoea sp. Mb-10]MCE0502222.1 hypothetical protein [Pantoea sp. Pb-8]